MEGNNSGTQGGQSTENAAGDGLLEKNITRRRMMQATGAAAGAAVAAGAGVGTVAASHGPSLDHSSAWIDDPYINGSIRVDVTDADMSALDYVADDGEVTNLSEHGVVTARADDDETPHNPVTLKASDIDAGEFHDFPRGITYDDDSDSSTDEVPVQVTDATHWSTDVSGSAGSITVSNPSDGVLRISTSSQTSGDTAIATFDLSSVGSNDATISSGMSRKILQQVIDVDTLESGVQVDYVIKDSAGNSVMVSLDPDGDASTVSVASSSTGDSQVAQTRVGDLEDDQSTTLDDIQSLEVHVSEANATVDHHGINLERSTEWALGQKEQADGNGGVETVDVVSPSGSYSIISYDSLPDWAKNATIRDLVYDVELRASKLPQENVHVRTKEAPKSYDRRKALEYLFEYEWPSAYALENVSASDLRNEVAISNSRYLAFDVATGVSDLTDDSDDDTTVWEDADNVSWTDKIGSLGSAGSDVQLLSSTSSGDRSAVRVEVNLSDAELDAATSPSGGTGAVAAGGDGGGIFTIPNMLIGGLLGAIAVFREEVMAFITG